MFAVQNPVAQPIRKPLHPLNTNTITPTPTKTKLVPKRDVSRTAIETELVMMMEGLDSSLGEELIEMRKRVERLKLDKVKTEERFKEKDLVFEMWIRDLEKRGDEQIKLEIEMDRVYRINELRDLTVRFLLKYFIFILLHSKYLKLDLTC